MTTIEPRQVDESAVQQLASVREAVPNKAIMVRPNEDNSGIGGMSDVLRSLPGGQTEGTGLLGRKTVDAAPPFAFEMRYARPKPTSERVVSLQYVAPDDALDARLGRHIQDKYPDSIIERRDPRMLEPDPGQYLAAATLGLRRYCLYPIANPALGDFDRDPTGSILRELAGSGGRVDTGVDVVAQVMTRPIGTDWRDGVPGGFGIGDDLAADETEITRPLSIQELRYVLTEPTDERRAILPSWAGGEVFKHCHPMLRDDLTHEPSEADKAAEKMLSDLDGRGWGIHIRILALSDDPEMAQRRVGLVAEMFDNFYEYRSRQTFLPIPQNGNRAIETAIEATARSWPEHPEQEIVKSHIETASLTNIPRAEDVHVDLQWAMSTPGDGIPHGTPRADWDSLPVDPGAASKEEQQVALLEADDGIRYYGLGARHGTEAGVNYDLITNPHKFVHGASGNGKTTFLATDASQQFREPGGGLRIDPPGEDTDDWLAEWPEDRPAEDLIYMDLTGDYERIPRFNFLEIPEYLEPDTREFVGFVEKLAEDLIRMIGVAGGTDEYVGTFMKRVLKTVVRGMMHAGIDATLDDLAAVCSSTAELDRFAAHLPSDETADLFDRLRERVHTFAERNDTDLDPLAGRLDEWVLNPNVQELICAREPTFSVTEAVREGKEIVVRMPGSGSDTVKHMVGSALITRTYFAQRFHDTGEPFELVVDEGQSILKSASDIETIMDQGRKFGYRVTLACQRPSSQLDETIRKAILGNARTVISYDSNRIEDARAVIGQHDGIDESDLTNLSPFTFYMNTETEDRESTYSYKVKAFRTPREARAMAGIEAESDTDSRVESLKQASLDAYGATKEEVTGGGAGMAALLQNPVAEVDIPEQTVDVATNEGQQRLAVQAVYDTAIRQGDADAAVPIDATLPALRRRLDWDGDAVDAHQQVYQHVRDAWLAIEGEAVRARNPRNAIAHVGENRSAGGAGHASLLWDAYHGLTAAGLDVSVSAASGTDPDGLATPIEDPAEPDLVDQLLGDAETLRIEAECTTATKPGALITHLNDAHDNGRHTLVLARPDVGDTVRDTVFGDPPGYRSGHGVSGERRLYTTPRDLGSGEDPPTIPGRESVWIERDGAYILRDDQWREQARFETAEGVFDGPYPGCDTGNTVIKRPAIPQYDPEDVALVEVPEGAETLGALSIERYPTVGNGDTTCGVTPDIPDRAEPLYECLQAETNGTVTKTEAVDLAEAHGLDISQASVYRHMGDLEDAGVLIPGEKTETGATKFSLR